MRNWGLGLLFACIATNTVAQDLVIYTDDADGPPASLQNGFSNYSYATPPAAEPNFSNATPVRSGTTSIAFTPRGFNALSIAHEGQTFAQAQYLGVRFYVHGGATGNQNLSVNVYDTLGNVVDTGPLASYVQGGAIGANEWRLAEVRFASPPIGYPGSFVRFDIQDGGDGSEQPTVFIDDVALISATRPDPIFLDGFEGDAAAPAGTLQFTPAAPDQIVGENAGTATFTVTRVGGSAGIVGTTVALGGTAANPADYTNSALALTWANGDTTSRSVTLTIVDDAIDEPNETVTLTLGAPTGGATLGAPSSATLTITDNDPAPAAGTLQFTPASPNQSATETSGAITFTVSRVGGSAGSVGTTVALSGSATNPADYTNGPLALSWPNGDATNRTVTITPVADLVDEPSESVTLQLGAPTGGATLGAPSSATLTITDAELMFVPQFATRAIKVYRRAPAGFALVNTAGLAVGIEPNALAFAPDGKLWVVDRNKRLFRYDRNAVVATASPVAEATIGLNVDAGVDFIDMAFFGDFAYVSQAGTNRILKYSLASLAATGNPVPAASLTNANFNVPAGLEFDPNGRLWVTSVFNNRLVRIDATTGVSDRVGTNVGTAGARNALNNAEGVAFDTSGTLWVGNNGEPTITGYAAWQLADAGFGATAPVHQIDISPGTFGGIVGYVGGVAFDSRGRLWANYEKTLEVLEYVLTPQPRAGFPSDVGSYGSAIGQRIANATTNPGFGGLAFWPVPPTVFRAPGGNPVAALSAQRDVVVSGRTSDRYSWIDASGNPRSAALAHNNNGTPGGSLRELTYRVGAATRTVGVTDSGFSVGAGGGFGYIVSHLEGYRNDGTLDRCTGPVPVESPLGAFITGQFQRLATGNHHAIHRYTLVYPLYGCETQGGAITSYPMAVTIDWFFATGRDHPVWAVTLDSSSAPVSGAVRADSRSPYGELLFDGSATSAAHATIAGVAWGDGRGFTTTSSPVTYNSSWTWNTPNTVPFVKLWTTAPDATMGTVQTQTKAQHDAGGYFGAYDWDKTSADDPAGCTPQRFGPLHEMPCDFNWPYQSLNYELNSGAPDNSTNGSRLAWGTNFGFVGRDDFVVHGSQFFNGPNPDTFADGYPLQSYSTYIVLGTHSGDPVGAQVREIEAVQQTTFSATVGTVAVQGPAGPGRVDNAPFQPAGWDHVYGVWSVTANANSANVNFAVAAGSLRNPILDVHGWVGTTLPASVTLNGAALVRDVDYFPSILDGADALLITLNRTLAGANNRVVVTQ